MGDKKNKRKPHSRSNTAVTKSKELAVEEVKEIIEDAAADQSALDVATAHQCQPNIVAERSKPTSGQAKKQHNLSTTTIAGSRTRRATSNCVSDILKADMVEDEDEDAEPVKKQKVRFKDVEDKDDSAWEPAATICEEDEGESNDITAKGEEDEMSEVEVTVPASKPKSKNKPFDIIFKVPDGTTTGVIERVKVSSTISSDELVEKLYVQVGCSKMKTKPAMLLYRLDMRGADLMKLSEEAHWEGLKEEFISKQSKRKDGTVIGIQLVVPGDYLASMFHTLKKAKGKTQGTHGHGSGASKQKEKADKPIIDLNASSDAESSETSEDLSGLSKREEKFIESLKNEYGSCNRPACKGKICKVNKNGEHVALSWCKLRSWALALGSNMYGVTLKCPPKGEGFDQFHGPPGAVPRSTKDEPPAAPIAAGHIALGAQGPYPFLYQPYYLHPQPYFAPQAEVTRTPGQSKRATLSSPDSPDVDLSTYPSIDEFLDSLAWEYGAGKRNMELIKEKLAADAVYNIYELKRMTPKELTETFGLLWGDANFLTRAIAGGIKKAQRE